jgi:hypothetical protein
VIQSYKTVFHADAPPELTSVCKAANGCM